MKTTLVLDDQLHREAKKKALELGIPLTRFIEEALRLRLAQSKSRPKKNLKPLPVLKGGKLRPGLSLDDMDTIYEAMDRGLPVEKLR
jgi:hypothetical protein